MKTIEELTVEISILKDRLDKAIIFEVTADISIGISEVDGLFRIRKINEDGNIFFLNKNFQWEEQSRHIDLAYSERTGYYTADEAFDAFEVIEKIEIPIFNSHIMKNN